MKKRSLLLIILLIILLILCPTLVLASTNTKSRDGVDNYGVTKFKVTDKNEQYVLDTPYVDESEKIYDFSEILTEEEETKILEEIREFNEKTNFDLVILTKDLYYNDDQENEDFATDFYDFNSFDKNGLLFFRNTNEDDPYFDLYSFGEAQLYFYDSRLSYILDDIYDNIHEGNYYDGIHQIIEELYSYYDEGKLDNYFLDKNGMLVNGDEYYLDKNGNVRKIRNYKAPILPAIVVSGIITGIIVGIMVGKNKMIHLATDATIYTNHENINMRVNRDELVNSITNRTYIPPSDSGSGFSGGGGGHSSSMGHSGGGHSSGGGRHG